MNKQSKLFSFSINTLYQLLSRAVTAVSALVLVRFLIHTNGIDVYGAYQTVIVYTSFYWIITDFGLNALFVRDIKRNENDIGFLYSINLTTRLILGGILMVISILGLYILNYPTEIFIAAIIGSLTILFQSVLGANTVIFQAKLQYKFYFLSQIIGSLISVIVTITLAYFTNSIILLTLGYVLGNFIMMLAGIVFARQFVPVQLSKNFAVMKKYFLLSIPVGLSLIFSLGVNKIDSIIMSSVKLESIDNRVAIGIYLLAYKVFELTTLLGVLSMNTLYPILSEYYGNNQFKHIQRILVKISILMLSASIFMIVLVSIFNGVIYSIIAPDVDRVTIDAVKNVLQILLIGLPLFYLTPLPMFGLIIMGKQKSLLIIYFLGFTINFLANYLFIPKFAYYAGAVITGLTELILFISLYSVAGWYWFRIIKQTND